MVTLTRAAMASSTSSRRKSRTPRSSRPRLPAQACCRLRLLKSSFLLRPLMLRLPIDTPLLEVAFPRGIPRRALSVRDPDRFGPTRLTGSYWRSWVLTAEQVFGHLRPRVLWRTAQEIEAGGRPRRAQRPYVIASTLDEGGPHRMRLRASASMRPVAIVPRTSRISSAW
jgi:hypothetical protein